MVESAGADVVIVMGGESSQNELIVQPEIKSIADLRGRKVLVDAPNTAYALQLKKILLMNGLQPGKDFDMKPVGSTPYRLQGMKDDKGERRRDPESSFLDPRKARRAGQSRFDAETSGSGSGSGYVCVASLGPGTC